MIEHRIFLLSEPVETYFIKNSLKGLFGTKKYFNNIAIEGETIEDLCKRLYHKNWSDFENIEETKGE